MSSIRPLPRSLYAAVARPAPVTGLLAGDTSVDVLIVGGGITGLSAALHLAEAGRQVLAIEANDIGWGASGRNGGQVNPGLKWEPEELEAGFGADLGGRMARLGGGAPDLVFELIARHGIDCEPVRGGTLRAAGPPRSEAGIRAHARQWSERGADVVLLDAAEMAATTGTAAYRLGAHDRRGGNLNPLSYTRGLADAALKAGARIATGTPATGLMRSGSGWSVTTPAGTIRAERVILATNGYTDDLWPGLRQTVIPVYSSIASTSPLQPEVAAAILPARPVLYEMSASYAYYRIDAAGRFLMGGRSVLRDSSDFADYRGLIAHALALFPALRGASWDYCWNGQVAVTWDHLPHLHEPAEGLSIGLGQSQSRLDPAPAGCGDWLGSSG